VAWGGILAQAALLGAALALWSWHAASGSGALLRYCFVELNLAVLVINLLPVPPLDGALVWRLFGALRDSEWTLRQALLGWARRRRERRAEARGGGSLSGEPAAPSSGTSLSSGLSLPATRSSAPSTELPFAHGRGAAALPTPSGTAKQRRMRPATSHRWTPPARVSKRSARSTRSCAASRKDWPARGVAAEGFQ
jgi:hypothetical protein